MAAFHVVDMSTRKRALESFAQALGQYLPRHPIPEWWKHFERWYASQGRHGTPEDLDATKFLRTETFGYADENDDPDD